MTPSKSLLTGFALALLVSTPSFAEQAAPAPASVAEMQKVTLKGKVLEVMDASGYTYLQVDASQGKMWAAIPKATVTKGQDVELEPGAVMEQFPSRTLNRTFDKIVFSAGIKGSAAGFGASPAANAQAPAPDTFAAAMQAESAHSSTMGTSPHMDKASSSGGSQAAVVPAIETKIDKAEGSNSYTVGELFSDSKKLKDQKVKVRGKVVKISKMIMGKNWIHLQDGSGDPLKNTHDLVVTTMADPAKDSIVTVEGNLSTDKDFGYGYRYAVIIEDAEVK